VKTSARFPAGYLEDHWFIMDVHMGAQPAHLLVQVEMNALVTYIDSTGGNHELHLKGLSVFFNGLDENALRLGHKTMQGGIVRELKDVSSGQRANRLLTPVENRLAEMVTKLDLDRHIKASVQCIASLNDPRC
jgi:hypothetical protein